MPNFKKTSLAEVDLDEETSVETLGVELRTRATQLEARCPSHLSWK